MPKDPEEKILEFQDLFARDVVVDLEQGVVGPIGARFCLVVSPDSRTNARAWNLLDTANADVCHFKDFGAFAARALAV